MTIAAKKDLNPFYKLFCCSTKKFWNKKKLSNFLPFAVLKDVKNLGHFLGIFFPEFFVNARGRSACLDAKKRNKKERDRNKVNKNQER